MPPRRDDDSSDDESSLLPRGGFPQSRAGGGGSRGAPSISDDDETKNSEEDLMSTSSKKKQEAPVPDDDSDWRRRPLKMRDDEEKNSSDEEEVKFVPKKHEPPVPAVDPWRRGDESKDSSDEESTASKPVEAPAPDWRNRRLLDTTDNNSDSDVEEALIANQKKEGVKKEDEESSEEEEEEEEEKSKKRQDLLASMRECCSLGNLVSGAVARLLPFQVRLNEPPTELNFGTAATALLENSKEECPEDHVLKVEIIATGVLSEEPDILHPMVQLHVLDATTGEYLEKPQLAPLGKKEEFGATTTYENSSVISSDVLSSSYGGGVDEASAAVTHVLPVATPPCSLRGKSVAPSWNDVIVIDVPYRRLLDPSVLLIFELVDFRYIQGSSSQKSRRKSRGKYAHGLYGIAWAYLRPVGPKGNVVVSLHETSRHSLRLQLFEHVRLGMMARRQARQWGMATPPPPAAPTVPSAYLQFLRRSRRRYPSTLLVRVLPTPRLEPTTVTRRPRLPSEREAHAHRHRSTITESSSDITGNREEEELMMLRRRAQAAAIPDARSIRAAQRRRDLTECCLLPDRLLCRVTSGQRGALTVRFSPINGRILAVACSEVLRHPIRLYDATSVAPPELSAAAAAQNLLGLAVDADHHQGAILLAELEGHHGLVYDMRWSSDERFLITASADGTAKIWSMGALGVSSVVLLEESMGGPTTTPASNKKLNHQRSPSLLRSEPELFATLHHDAATYVYCAAFATMTQQAAEATTLRRKSVSDVMVGPIITGAFDGSVRLWEAAKKSSPQCRGLLGGVRAHNGSVNALEIEARSGRVYTADSVGVVVVWKRTGEGTDPSNYSVLRHLTHPDLTSRPIVSLALHPRRRRGQLLIQAQHSMLKLFDLTTGQPVAHYKGSQCRSGLIRAVFSPDGRVVLAGSDDGKCYAWDSASGERLPMPLSHVGYNAPLCDLSWHPTQHVLAMTCFGGDHPVLLYHAPRPNNPKLILAARGPPSKSATEDFDDREKTVKRKRRLMELQARRKVLMQEKERQAKQQEEKKEEEPQYDRKDNSPTLV